MKLNSAYTLGFSLFASLLFAIGCASSTSPGETAPRVKAAVTPAEVVDPGPERLVEIETDFGTMTVKLYNETPKHRDNFIKLASEGYYNDLLFHRVIKEFMVQGGDPGSKDAAPGTNLGSGGPGYTIPAEIKRGLYHKKGALSAARLGDAQNPRKESSGSQFYVVQGRTYSEAELGASDAKARELYTTVGGTPFLDNNYTVFGEVIEGLDVIDKIAAVETAPGDRPLEDVRMQVRVIEE